MKSSNSIVWFCMIDSQTDGTFRTKEQFKEFKAQLAAEITSVTEKVGQLREERKAIETELADMFALKAKYSVKDDEKKSA